MLRHLVEVVMAGVDAEYVDIHPIFNPFCLFQGASFQAAWHAAAASPSARTRAEPDGNSGHTFLGVASRPPRLHRF